MSGRVALIVADPAPAALIRPVVSTVATAELVDVKSNHAPVENVVATLASEAPSTPRTVHWAMRSTGTAMPPMGFVNVCVSIDA